MKNLNGRTWVGEVTGDLRVRSSNGDITIDRSHGQVAARTANGNIGSERSPAAASTPPPAQAASR